MSGVEARPGNDESAAPFLRNHPGTTSVQSGDFIVDRELSGLFANWSRDACARILARHGVDLDQPLP
jgi:hypothetical protein